MCVCVCVCVCLLKPSSYYNYQQFNIFINLGFFPFLLIFVFFKYFVFLTFIFGV
uniref:Uncharacterized protein n=1 Tax=Octopus bimaculoides TaxID=37653 RepID=A0A0L8I2Y4_OCTBM